MKPKCQLIYTTTLNNSIQRIKIAIIIISKWPSLLKYSSLSSNLGCLGLTHL